MWFVKRNALTPGPNRTSAQHGEQDVAALQCRRVGGVALALGRSDLAAVTRSIEQISQDREGAQEQAHLDILAASSGQTPPIEEPES
ncbi:hypothetical protein [Paraburkholderia sp. BR10954]|uniref:hypothetical protein n=1 Tax=Paraburkholderia sp. BR10954 TaxID=3236995 RepID=UPI0034D2262F